jgi:Zn finger protein HypA/HybF involved in hydrogenase expression
MTIPEAIEAMKRNVGTPGEAGAMLVLADVWEEHEANAACVRCRYTPGYNPVYIGLAYQSAICPYCHGTGYVSNGNSARAEALRLLAECGKVGHEEEGYFYPGTTRPGSDREAVSHGWYEDSLPRIEGRVVAADIHRLALMDAYAAADQPTREWWARETRALAVTKNAECEYCVRGVVVGNEAWDHYCNRCDGSGRVPAQQEASASGGELHSLDDEEATR